MKEVQTMNQLDVGLDEMIVRPKRQDRYNNAITDGGVARRPIQYVEIKTAPDCHMLQLSINSLVTLY